MDNNNNTTTNAKPRKNKVGCFSMFKPSSSSGSSKSVTPMAIPPPISSSSSLPPSSAVKTDPNTKVTRISQKQVSYVQPTSTQPTQPTATTNSSTTHQQPLTKWVHPSAAKRSAQKMEGTKLPATISKVSIHKIIVANPWTERAVPIHMGLDPNRENILYGCGHSIVIRNINNPDIVELYDDHSAKASCARFSPERNMLASADFKGKVKIWNVADRKLLYEYQVLGSKVLDMSWLPNSKGIAVAGEGSGRFAACFKIDSGGSLGDIVGHVKPAMSIAINPEGNEIVSGSMDMTVNVYKTQPNTFKYSTQLNAHKNFVNCLRFSPVGNIFATASTDKTCLIYETATNNLLATLTGHSGGVYSLAYSPDGKSIVTASADKTVAIWDVATCKCVNSYNLGDKIENQQLGVLWAQENTLVSVSLNADLNYFDPRQKSPTAPPTRVIRGHNKSITAMAYNDNNNTIFTGSYDGLINGFTITNNPSGPAFNDSKYVNVLASHSNEVKGITVVPFPTTTPNANTTHPGILSIGMDDCIREDKTTFLNSTGGSSLRVLDSFVSPTCSFSVIATTNSLQVWRQGRIVCVIPIAFTPSAIKISPNGTAVIVADTYPKLSLHIFAFSTTAAEATLTFQSKFETPNKGAILAIAFSANEKYLATCDKEREVTIFSIGNSNNVADVSQWKVVMQKKGFHNSSITDISFSPDSSVLVSVSNDQDIIVWSIANLNNVTSTVVRGAHKQGVNKVMFIDQSTFATCGVDGMVKMWKIM